MGDEPDEVVILPALDADPVFAESVDEAVTGLPLLPEMDPNRVLGADPHDFAGLYIRHRSSFALHARRFLRDQRDVDEVVQEGFLRLFLALPELDNELQALAYCRRTITNLCIDRYRADQRRPRLVDLDSVPLDALADDEPGDPVIQAEDAAVVRQALALLSPLHRAALIKREVEEKPLPVIAQELDVPEESVKHLLHRARRALRRHLAATHLAPGVDLDSMSTAALLARSLSGGGGKVGAVLLLVVAVLLGGTTQAHTLPLSALLHPERLFTILTGGGHGSGTARGAAPGVAPAAPGSPTPGLFLPPLLPGGDLYDLLVPATATAVILPPAAPSAPPQPVVPVAPAPVVPTPVASAHVPSTAVPSAAASAPAQPVRETPGPTAVPTAVASSLPSAPDALVQRVPRPGARGVRHGAPLSPDSLPPGFELSPPDGVLPPIDNSLDEVTVSADGAPGPAPEAPVHWGATGVH